MARIRVGVLRGGIGHEYEVSLKTGAAVLHNLDEDKYDARDILITRDGTWHWGGVPASPDKVARHADAVFNALHGEYGEDGQVQQLLDSLSIPYTGSEAYPSAVAMNKALAKEYFKKLGLKVPYGVSIEREDGSDEEIAKRVFKHVPCPWIVKPVGLGSSVGVRLARNFVDLIDGIKNAFSVSQKIIVEEFIRGREATCGVVNSFRGKDHYSLLPIQIIKPYHKKFFDYESKYDGSSQELCPGHFTREEKYSIQDAAKRVHNGLGLRHYSRTDMIVSKRGLYILEANTLPGLTNESLLPKSLEAIGCSYPEFLDHVLTLAINK